MRAAEVPHKKRKHEHPGSLSDHPSLTTPRAIPQWTKGEEALLFDAYGFHEGGLQQIQRQFRHRSLPQIDSKLTCLGFALLGESIEIERILGFFKSVKSAAEKAAMYAKPQVDDSIWMQLG